MTMALTVTDLTPAFCRCIAGEIGRQRNLFILATVEARGVPVDCPVEDFTGARLCAVDR